MYNIIINIQNNVMLICLLALIIFSSPGPVNISWCGSDTLCLHIDTLSSDCVCEGALVCIWGRFPLHLKGSSTEDDQLEIGGSRNKENLE